MDRAAYQAMSATQAHHWWFVARRQILSTVIANLKLPANARIAEIGCGPGGNLPMLSGFGRIWAMETDDLAREQAQQLTGLDVRGGSLPDQLPWGEQTFDLICLLDVLEHIHDDQQALAAIARHAHPGTRLLLTVPAYQWLFSSHDRLHHHHRRYTAGQLDKVARAAGWQPVRLGYFNTLLFPVAAMKRLVERFAPGGLGDDTQIPGSNVNRVLTRVFGTERAWIGRTLAPFGLSVLAVYQRAPTATPRNSQG